MTVVDTRVDEVVRGEMEPSDNFDRARFRAPGDAPALPPLPMRRPIPALTGLRGIAVLMVMAGHAGFSPLSGKGVDIFFVLSGFLITGSILAEFDKFGRLALRRFYVRRGLRLAPALLLTVGTYLVVSWISQWHMHEAVIDSAIVLSCTANWARAFGHHVDFLGHTWSVSLQEQFYLLWPLLLLGWHRWCGRRWIGLAACVAGIGLIIVYREWMAARGAAPIRIANGLDTRADVLLGGACLAFFMPRIAPRWAALLGWTGMVILGLYIARAFGTNWGLNATYVLKTSCVMTLLIGLLNADDGLLSRCLSFRPLAWVGTISYGLYLFHYPIFKYLLIFRGSTYPEVAMLGLPLTFALAAASYYALEKPFLRMKSLLRPG